VVIGFKRTPDPAEITAPTDARDSSNDQPIPALK
jgi:hypothetical protein